MFKKVFVLSPFMGLEHDKVNKRKTTFFELSNKFSHIFLNKYGFPLNLTAKTASPGRGVSGVTQGSW